MRADALLLPLAMAVAAGLVGCFAVMRRMTLASDALSHVALPGIGLALALQLKPVLGGVVALLADRDLTGTGIEVDILEDGALDLPDSILKRLDLVIGAVHSKFDLSRARQTERLLAAMEQPTL